MEHYTEVKINIDKIQKLDVECKKQTAKQMACKSKDSITSKLNALFRDAYMGKELKHKTKQRKGRPADSVGRAWES